MEDKVLFKLWNEPLQEVKGIEPKLEKTRQSNILTKKTCANLAMSFFMVLFYLPW